MLSPSRSGLWPKLSVSTHSSNADIYDANELYTEYYIYALFTINYIMVIILASFRGSPLEGSRLPTHYEHTLIRFETGEPSTYSPTTALNFKTRVTGREYRAVDYTINVITQGPYPALAKRARHLFASLPAVG
jgi:hypothetical protein